MANEEAVNFQSSAFAPDYAKIPEGINGVHQRFFGESLQGADFPFAAEIFRRGWIYGNGSYARTEAMYALSMPFLERVHGASTQSPETAADILFHTVLQRDPDEEGHKVYAERFRSGTEDVQKIVVDVINSEEYRRRSFTYLYQELLGRDPDEEGLRAKTDRYQVDLKIIYPATAMANMINEVAQEITSSDEFRNLHSAPDRRNPYSHHEADQVALVVDDSIAFQRIYRRFFNRLPVLAELEHVADYARVLAQGVNMTEVEFAIAKSARFAQRIDLLATHDQVGALADLYRGILERDPDKAGLDSYLQQLQTGARINNIMASMLTGDEYYDLMLRKLYQDVLGREVDEEGKTVYMGHLRSGIPIETIARDMRGSDEAKQKTSGTKRHLKINTMGKTIMETDVQEPDLTPLKVEELTAAPDPVSAIHHLLKTGAMNFIATARDPNRLSDTNHGYWRHELGFEINKDSGAFLISPWTMDRYEVPFADYGQGHAMVVLTSPYPSPEGVWKMRIYDPLEEGEREVVLPDFNSFIFGDARDGYMGAMLENNHIFLNETVKAAFLNGTHDVSISRNPLFRRDSESFIKLYLPRTQAGGVDCVPLSWYMAAQLVILQPENSLFARFGKEVLERDFSLTV